MSSTTKRWMQEELTQLVSQRRQIKTATTAAHTPAQRRRRTQRLRALDEEILGRSEALAALARHERDEVVVRRDEAVSDVPRIQRRPTSAHRTARRRPTAAFRTLATQRAPKIGDTLSLMATPQTEPTRAVARVVGGSFAVGFFLMAVTMWSTGLGQPQNQVGPVRAQQQAAKRDHAPKAAPARKQDRRRRYEDRVFAATAPAKRR